MLLVHLSQCKYKVMSVFLEVCRYTLRILTNVRSPVYSVHTENLHTVQSMHITDIVHTMVKYSEHYSSLIN